MGDSFKPDAPSNDSFQPDAPKDSFQPDTSMLSKLGGYLKQGLNAKTAFDMALIKGGTLGNVDPASWHPALKQDADENPIPSKVGQILGGLGTGMATGSGISALAPEGAGVINALGRIGLNAAGGAAQGAAAKPAEGGSRLTNGFVGGAIGGGVSAAGEMLAAPASKLADYLQQKAMGLKKYIPGLGTDAIEQGIRGSKDTMADQVESNLSQNSDRAGQMIGKLGRVDSADAAQPVADYAQNFKVGETIPGNSLKDYANASDRAQEIAARGPVSADDAWSFAKKAGAAGYRNQKALQSEDAYLAQLEQQGYSNALKKSYTEANPGNNDLADLFSNMSGLYKMKQGLNADSTIRAGLPLNALAGAGVGAASNPSHPWTGAAEGALGALVLRNPAVQSYGAAGLNQAAETATNPLVLQSLFGGALGADLPETKKPQQ